MWLLCTTCIRNSEHVLGMQVRVACTLNCMGNMASIIHPHIIVEKFNTYGMYTVVYTMDYASVWAQD